MKAGETYTLRDTLYGLTKSGQTVPLHAGSTVTVVMEGKSSNRVLVEDGIGHKGWAEPGQLGPWHGQVDVLAQGEHVLYPAKEGGGTR